MAKTPPAWDVAVNETYDHVDAMAAVQANAVGEALNDLPSITSTSGLNRVGLDSAEFDFDGQQDVQTYITQILR